MPQRLEDAKWHKVLIINSVFFVILGVLVRQLTDGEKGFLFWTKKLIIMNRAYGLQSRGDPPLTFGIGVDSFKKELIFSRITDQNDQDGRGMLQTMNSEQ